MNLYFLSLFFLTLASEFNIIIYIASIYHGVVSEASGYVMNLNTSVLQPVSETQAG